MVNILTDYSENVRWYLTSNYKPGLKISKPDGWNDYGLSAARNMDYHGTLTMVTEDITFYGEAKDYIEQSWRLDGIRAQIGLIRSVLKEKDGDVKFVPDRIVFADFHKWNKQGNGFTIPFTTNNLMDLIDGHEDDDFELERLETVENETIPPMPEMFIALNGRSVQSVGEFKNELPGFQNTQRVSVPTSIVSEGPTRHSKASLESFSSGWENMTASALFYDNLAVEDLDTTVTLNYNLTQLRWGRVRSGASTANLRMRVYKVRYNQGLGTYSPIEYQDIVSWEDVPKETQRYESPKSGILEFQLTWEEGLVLVMESDDLSSFFYSSMIFDCIINDVEFFEPSPSLNFTMVHDVFQRLMQILTRREDAFYSSFFGRTEKGYKEDGEGGLMGFISGFWIRAFNKTSEKYKSPKISLKDLITSCVSVFNVGAGVETYKNKERLVVEDLSYFYRNEVVVKFPQQITNQKRIVDASSFYSSIEMGYEKGGSYEDQMGLDEPNVKSKWTTPVHNTRNKFESQSKVRADEYGIERLRRKPQEKYPNESITGDEDNWFLDLKRNEDDPETFEQVSWQDRLSEEPQGIHSPSTFRSMFFTPLRCFFRMAKNFNSGTYLFKNMFMNFASSSSNRSLEMKFIGEENSYKESQNIPISSLKKPIFKNEKLIFTHPVDDALKDLIFGQTKVTINGEERLIPNFFFKFEWLNESNELERGYFLKMENGPNPEFEFQIANEELI